MSSELKPVTVDNIHIILPQFINDNKIIIGSYEDMMDVILRMIKSKYFFAIDKELLRSSMEDLTFMYCPGDDLNKDRVLSMLEPSDEEDEEEDAGEDGTRDIEEIPAP